MNVASISNRLFKIMDRVDTLSIHFKFFAFFTLFVSPLLAFMQILIILVFIDLISSVYAQYKKRKRRYPQTKKTPGFCFVIFWRTLKPERIVETVEKIVLYSFSLIIGFVLDYYILRQEGLDPNGFLHLLSTTNAIYVLLLGTEAVSVFRNFREITKSSVFTELINLISRKPDDKEKSKQS